MVLEKATEIGGTWRDNTYPGCACDVPSVLYSFSFAPNPDWSRSFSRQPEIWDYLRDCVDRFNLRPYLRLGVELRAGDLGRRGPALADPDERRRPDRRRAGRGDRAAVRAADPGHPGPGLLRRARSSTRPAGGTTIDLTGRDVAVVGTGASAIQFVPQIAPQVGRLTVFQRTAALGRSPRSDRAGQPASTHAAYRRLPVRAAGRPHRACTPRCELLVLGTAAPADRPAAAADRRAQPAPARSRTRGCGPR